MCSSIRHLDFFSDLGHAGIPKEVRLFPLSLSRLLENMVIISTMLNIKPTLFGQKAQRLFYRHSQTVYAHDCGQFISHIKPQHSDGCNTGPPIVENQKLRLPLSASRGEQRTATAEAEKDVAHPFDGKSMFLSAFRGGEPRGGKVVKGFFVLSPTVRSPSLNPENTDFSQLGKRVPGKWGCPETFPANQVEVLVVSRVHLCATPWTVTRQAPLSSDKNARVGCHFLLQDSR